MRKSSKWTTPFKLTTFVALLSFLCNFVFVDYAAALLVKKSATELMEEEPSTRRTGGISDQAQTVDTMNALLALTASPQTVTSPNDSALVNPDNMKLEQSALSHADMVAALNLVKDSDATLKVSGTVNLSDLVAQGKIREGEKIVIGQNSVLVIDQVSSVKISWIRVDGQLKFSTDRNTQLSVGTLVVNDMGRMDIGSVNSRVQADKTAKLVFADMGNIAEDKNDLRQIGHGLIAMGEVHVYGAESAENILPSSVLTKGSTSMTLSQSASGWKVGDTILLVSTANSVGWSSVDQGEKVTVTGISADGRTISFDRALTYDHVMPDGTSPPVANMTHNVQISSENQADITHHGHVMIMGWGEFEGVSFTALGRTTSAIVTDPVLDADGNFLDAAGNKVLFNANGDIVDAQGNVITSGVQNIRGRYAVHFHRTGIDATAPVNLVQNCSVDAGPDAAASRWGGVNHSSKVNFIDNVFYGFTGTNLVADEKGDALGYVSGNITDRSTGIGGGADMRTRGGFVYSNALGQVVEDTAHMGHGIWLQGGGGVLVQGNWVFGNNAAGIIYWRLTIKDAGKNIYFPVENITDISVLDSLRPGNFVTIDGKPWNSDADGKKYVSVDAIPAYCIGNVIGSSGGAITMSYNMMGHTKTDADVAASRAFSVIKDNIGFALTTNGIFTSYSQYINIQDNILLRDNSNSNQGSTWTYGAAVSGNDFTGSINITNLTAKGFTQGISVPENGTTTITGGYLENYWNICISAPFQGDLAADADPATSVRKTIIDRVAFGFYKDKPSYNRTPYIDIYLQGTDNNGRDEGYDKSVWDFARNPVIIRGNNVNSLVMAMNYKGAMASGENPNYYFVPEFVSPEITNQLSGYIAELKSMYAFVGTPNFKGSPVDLVEGLNILHLKMGTIDQPLIVFGDSKGPSFEADPNMKLEIKESDLAKGFDVIGSAVDQTGNLRFENAFSKHFSDLTPNAFGYVTLTFNITDKAGNVSAVTLNLKVIKDTIVIPPAVQAMADTLQQQVGDGYKVEIKPDEAHPGNFLFVVHPVTPVATPLVATTGSSKLTSLSVSTDKDGKLDVNSIQATFNNVAVNGPMLYAGLSQIIGSDPFSAMADMTLTANDSAGIHFDLDGNSLMIAKDAQGNVKMTAISYDALIKIGDKYKLYARGANDLQRGDILRQAVKDMKAGDTLLLGEGGFDCDGKNKGVVRFANNITVIGRGADKTHLFSNSYSDGQGAAFQVRNGTFSELTFENQSWQINEDGRTIEMYDGLKFDDKGYYVYENGHKVVEEANVGPFTANFDHVKFVGNAWVVYDWSGRGHTWNITDCTIISGRQGVSMMSGGGYMQTANIVRTVFDIDTMRSQDIGWTSNRNVGGAYAIVARGGHIKVQDCTFNIKSGQTPNQYSYAPRAVGIYDGNDFDSTSSAWTYLELVNNHWNIDGRGAKDTYDIFMTNQGAINNLKMSGGYGSGVNGLVTKNWGSDIPPVLPLTDAVKTILANLKAKMVDAYVDAYADPSAPGTYVFNIVQDITSTGHIRMLKVVTDGDGHIDNTKPMLATFTMGYGTDLSADAKMLFDGLSQMAGVNALSLIADMAALSADANSIRFTYNNKVYEIQKAADGSVRLIQASQAIKLAVQTTPYGNTPDLFVSVDENHNAIVTYQGQTYKGVYTEFIFAKGSSMQRTLGRITVKIDDTRSWYATILTMNYPLNGVTVPPYLSSFVDKNAAFSSSFGFDRDGLLIYNSISGTNYWYNVYYTYTKINNKNYIASIVQTGHTSFVYYPTVSGSGATPGASGYSWTSKSYYAYDTTGKNIISVSVSSNTPDNGKAVYSASYNLTYGNTQVYVSVSLDKDISSLINSAQDYKIIDQYATIKTEYYNNYQTILTSVKDAYGVFVPRYIQSGNQAFIVRGQPDMLFPNDKLKDISIQPWQTVNGYSVYYGAAYSYSNGGPYYGYYGGTSSYLGYGLVFTKWETKSDGTYVPVTTVVDFPNTSKVVLDGKLYQIKVDAKGAVQLALIEETGGGCDPIIVSNPLPVANTPVTATAPAIQNTTAVAAALEVPAADKSLAAAIKIETPAAATVAAPQAAVAEVKPAVELTGSWIRATIANSVKQNEDITVQYKLAQPVGQGQHIHCHFSAQPVTAETVKTIALDKVEMSWPDTDGQSGRASLSTKGVAPGEYYISVWGVTKDHDYDGNGIMVRKVVITPIE